MAIVLYISLLLSPPFLLFWYARRYGSFAQSQLSNCWQPFLAVPLILFYVVFFHSWSFEGANSLVFVFYGINVLIALAGFRGKKMWALGFFVLLFSFFLEIFHARLASSAEYTDSPSQRNMKIRRFNRTRTWLGLPLLPKVVCKPEWHTFLTQLYTVRPKP